MKGSFQYLQQKQKQKIIKESAVLCHMWLIVSFDFFVAVRCSVLCFCLQYYWQQCFHEMSSIARHFSFMCLIYFEGTNVETNKTNQQPTQKHWRKTLCRLHKHKQKFIKIANTKNKTHTWNNNMKTRGGRSKFSYCLQLRKTNISRVYNKLTASTWHTSFIAWNKFYFQFAKWLTCE